MEYPSWDPSAAESHPTETPPEAVEALLPYTNGYVSNVRRVGRPRKVAGKGSDTHGPSTNGTDPPPDANGRAPEEAGADDTRVYDVSSAESPEPVAEPATTAWEHGTGDPPAFEDPVAAADTDQITGDDPALEEPAAHAENVAVSESLAAGVEEAPEEVHDDSPTMELRALALEQAPALSAAEPEAAASADVAEPEAIAEPEAPAEPEAIAEPEAPAEPEAIAEPEAPAEPEPIAEPEAPAEPEAIAEPEPEPPVYRAIQWPPRRPAAVEPAPAAAAPEPAAEPKPEPEPAPEPEPTPAVEPPAIHWRGKRPSPPRAPVSHAAPPPPASPVAPAEDAPSEPDRYAPRPVAQVEHTIAEIAPDPPPAPTPAPAPAPPTAAIPAPAPAPPPPPRREPTTTAPTGFRERGRLRQRATYLRHLREMQIRDLGGFVLELHRYETRRDDLVAVKLEEAAETDRELRALESVLSEERPVREVREAGIGGACSQCGAIHGSLDRFCSACGASVLGEAPARVVTVARRSRGRRAR